MCIRDSRYTSNCNSSNCGLAYTSNVASGNTLVIGLGWLNNSPPSTPTDTRSDTFTLGASNSITVTPPTPAVVQKGYTSNCNAANCALAYTSSVSTGNTLAYALGWYGHSPPATPTDTLGDAFALGPSTSVVSGTVTPSIVQQRYTSNCNSASCGLAYTSNVASGDTLAYALGWYAQSAPSTPTDTLGDTFTLGASNSVTVAAGGTPSLVQSRYTSNCNSASCGLAFTSNVASGNILAYALGWYGQNPPSTPTDTQGNSFTLGASKSITASSGGTPTLVQSRYTSNCNAASCGLAYNSNVASGDILAFGLGWYGHSPPATPTDTLGDTFTLGVSKSVTAGGSGPASFIQSKFAANCNSASCGAAYTSAVATGDVLVFGLGWQSQNPPSTPTDTLGDNFQLGVSSSVNTQSMVPGGHTYACSGDPCGQSFNNPVTQGDILVFELGWANHAAPSTPTDSLGDTFTLGTSNSVTAGANTYYSYIWYTTAGSSGSDTISATFGASVGGSVWVDDLSGYTTTGYTTSTGSSSAGSTSASVTSFNPPAANSVVIGHIQANTGATGISSGGSFNQDGGCGSGVACSEYATGQGTGGTTVPFTLSTSQPWVETAISFKPSSGTPTYSYIWYATVKSGGSDTITASFGSTVAGSVSMYEISGYTPVGYQQSTGGSSTGSTAASVASFTPAASSFVVGDVETGSTSTQYTMGSGYTSVQTGAGGCDPTHSAQGCGEYQSGVSSATTVPFTLSPSAVWVESAISFPVPTPVFVNNNTHTYNCGSTNCGQTISGVTQGDILVFMLGWSGQSPPSTPTDTFGDSFTLAVSNSVTSGSTYYSYIWYATALNSGNDNISATVSYTHLTLPTICSV